MLFQENTKYAYILMLLSFGEMINTDLYRKKSDIIWNKKKPFTPRTTLALSNFCQNKIKKKS